MTDIFRGGTNTPFHGVQSIQLNGETLHYKPESINCESGYDGRNKIHIDGYLT